MTLSRKGRSKSRRHELRIKARAAVNQAFYATGLRRVLKESASPVVGFSVRLSSSQALSALIRCDRQVHASAEAACRELERRYKGLKRQRRIEYGKKLREAAETE